MGLLIPIDAIENFEAAKDFTSSSFDNEVLESLIDIVKQLDEREELEPWIRLILADRASTPHGPAELVDIFTHRITVGQQAGMAAFILKGKSFTTVRAADVAHQIYRLKKINGLSLAVFGAAGTILDAAKEQFVSTCEEIGCKYSIFTAEDLVRLFVAYGFFCPRDGSRIISGRCRRCAYSPNKRILNFLQREALEQLAYAHTRSQPSGLVVLPPGSGKTRIAAEDAFSSSANKVLFIAHTHEILEIAQSEFEAKFGTDNVRLIRQVSSLESPSRVSLATVNILARNLTKLSEGSFDYVIIDEFHHVAAVSYRRVLEKLNPPFLLGLTATPFRGDKQNVLKLCDNAIIVSYALRFGIETGVLCPFHYFGCFDDVDYSNIKHNGLRYSIRDLEKALVIPERDHAIIKKWRDKAEGKPTIAFCCSIRHAERVASSFNSSGIKSVSYTSSSSLEERQRNLKKFRTGTITVLCVVDVFNEGADLPFVECLLFLRPTESKRIYLQQLGRGLRRYPGKSFCIVIDFIGNFKNANRIVEYQDLLPIGEAEFSTDSSEKRHTKDSLNLPLGCEITFDDRVIDVFYNQTLDESYITNSNIRRILIFQYERLSRRLGRSATKGDIDRNCVIGSDIYRLCFGTWKQFESYLKVQSSKGG